MFLELKKKQNYTSALLQRHYLLKPEPRSAYGEKIQRYRNLGEEPGDLI